MLRNIILQFENIYNLLLHNHTQGDARTESSNEIMLFKESSPQPSKPTTIVLKMY